MKTLSSITLASLIGALVTLTAPGVAQATDHDKAVAAGKPASAADLTDGEIKKVDKDNKKLTIKHGDIKSLDMPGMTMVFKVKDPVMIDSVKVGDKVRFAVENLPTGLVVTELVQAGK